MELITSHTVSTQLIAKKYRGVIADDVAGVLYFLFEVLEFLFLFRLLFLLLRASVGSPMVQLVNTATQPFLTPFAGLFPQVRGRIALSILVAMFAYALLAYLFDRVIELLDQHNQAVSTPKQRRATEV